LTGFDPINPVNFVLRLKFRLSLSSGVSYDSSVAFSQPPEHAVEAFAFFIAAAI
jgi:hypothetical protein